MSLAGWNILARQGLPMSKGAKRASGAGGFDTAKWKRFLSTQGKVRVDNDHELSDG